MHIWAVTSNTLAGGCATAAAPGEAPRTSVRPNGPSGNPASEPDALAPLEVAEPRGSVTLKDAIGYALLNSPSLKVFSLEIRIADDNERLAELDYETKRLDVMNQVILAFIDVLAAQEQRDLADAQHLILYRTFC